jgi:hypothetical protein
MNSTWYNQTYPRGNNVALVQSNLDSRKEIALVQSNLLSSKWTQSDTIKPGFKELKSFSSNQTCLRVNEVARAQSNLSSSKRTRPGTIEPIFAETRSVLAIKPVLEETNSIWYNQTCLRVSEATLMQSNLSSSRWNRSRPIKSVFE